MDIFIIPIGEREVKKEGCAVFNRNSNRRLLPVKCGWKAAILVFLNVFMCLLRTSFPEFDGKDQSSDQHCHRHEQQQCLIAFLLSGLIEGET